MFISPLIEKINAYDPFRIHYCNGLRALVALLSLFVINYFYSINNPYFYFFYIPITCLSLETLGETNIEKAKIYFLSVLWSAIGVAIFSLTANHPVLELGVVFTFSLGVYYVFIKCYPHPLISAATILSLSAYGLNYQNLNLYKVGNNFGITMLAAVIIVVVLNLFPKKMYLQIWCRIFCRSLSLANNLSLAQRPQDEALQIFKLFPLLLRYARISKQTNLIKTTLSLQTFLHHCIARQIYPHYFTEHKDMLQQNLNYLFIQVQQNSPCQLVKFSKSNPTAVILYNIARDWNRICENYN